MSARGKVPSSYEGRSFQAPGMMRHGPFPGSEGLGSRRPGERRSPVEISEKQLALQEAEIEQLASDNHRLAATHVAMREDLAAAQQEIQRIKAHIKSTQTESDIQIRVLLDKISKMGADIRAGEGVKKELQQAHLKAQSVAASRQELTTQIEKATQELQGVWTDIKRLPDMHAELDSLRQEHQRLRATFEYEKGINIQKVEQMQVMDTNMVGMAREVEKLRAEVLNVEKRAHVPNYAVLYVNPDPSYPPPQGSVAYVDGYGRPYSQASAGFAGENASPYAANGPVNPVVGGAPVSGPGSGAVWPGTYDPNLTRS